MRLGGTPVPIPNTTVKTQAADGTARQRGRAGGRQIKKWGYSSVGRAPALQAGGREFESLYLHWFQKMGPKKEGLIAQLVRAHA